MPVTTNYGIPTQDDPNLWNIVTDNAITANAVDLALLKVDTLRVGTGAQRAAFSTAPNGLHWQDTDGQQLEYVRTGGVWLALGSKAYSGTAAQRTAFTTAPPGSLWTDTDGTKQLYSRDGAAWVLVQPIESTGTPVLGSGWTGVVSPGLWDGLKVTKWGRMVTVSGAVQKGTFAALETAATLPVGFRPATTFPATSYTSAPTYSVILPDGRIQPATSGFGQLTIGGTFVVA